MYGVDPVIIFALILIISLIIPEILKEMRILEIPFYIVSGILLGPQGLGFVANEALMFIGDIGLLFLVFIAGLEIREFGRIKWGKPVKLSVISAGICFIFGFGFGFFWGFSILTSLLLGTILMSSSVGEIIPIVTSSAHLRERFSEFLLPAIIIMDAASLFLITVLIQWDSDIFHFTLFLIGALIFIVLIVYVLPRVAQRFFGRRTIKPRETDLKFVITVLAVSVAIGELINLHGILTAFLVGSVLGHHIPGEKIYQKLYGFGYGFFIPIFFVVLGMNLDISFLFRGGRGITLILLIPATLILSKITGGILFSMVSGMKRKEGLVLGVTLWPQLSATLAAAAVGAEYGIFNNEILTAVVFMAISTAISTPFVVQSLIRTEGKKHSLRDHIVIIGYGRTSARLAYLLEMDGNDFVVIDQKLSRIRLLRKQGIPAVLGSGEEPAVLEMANIKEAKAAVITIPDDHEVYLCARHIREMNPHCYTIVRVHTNEVYGKLRKEGLADFTVWPERLSSDQIIKRIIDENLWGKDEEEQGVD